MESHQADAGENGHPVPDKEEAGGENGNDCRLHVGTKTHWGSIYVEASPMPYYTTMTPYDYGFFHDRFLGLFSAELDRHFTKTERLQVVEIGSSYGNTTLAYKCGLDWEAVGGVWSEDSNTAPRAIRNLDVTAIDMSKPALEYGLRKGVFDRVVVHDFNAHLTPELMGQLESADVLVLIMISSYIRTLSFQKICLTFLGDRSKKKVLAYNDTCAFDTRNLSPEALFAGIKGWTASQHFFKHRNFTKEESALRHGCKESWSYTYLVTFHPLEYDNKNV